MHNPPIINFYKISVVCSCVLTAGSLKTQAEPSTAREYDVCRSIRHSIVGKPPEVKISILVPAVRQHPDYKWYFLYDIGVAQHEAGKKVEAIKTLSLCKAALIEAHPNSVEGRYAVAGFRRNTLLALSSYYEEQNNIMKAKSTFSEAAEDSMSKSVWTKYADFLARNGFTQESINARHQADELMQYPGNDFSTIVDDRRAR